MYWKSEAIIKIKELGRLYKQGDISEQFYNDKVAKLLEKQYDKHQRLKI